MAPQSDVYQARYLLLASINACLKLGSGLHLPAVSGLVGTASSSLLGGNLETGARYQTVCLLEFNLRSGSLRWSLNPRSGLSMSNREADKVTSQRNI